MKKILVLSLISFLASIAYADHEPGHGAEPLSRNTIFFETFGAGINLYSINYDRILVDDMLSARAGFSYLPLFGITWTTIPLTVNYIGFKSGGHIFEVGGGATLYIISAGGNSDSGDLNPLISGTQGVSGFGASFVAPVGYRYQGKHFNFRAGGTLIAGGAKGFTALPHLSLGFSF